MSSLALSVPVPSSESPVFRETFKMVNVPMLRKTFCPHPDCKATKPFRVTNYKSLNEEVTSRKRRLRCWWFDAFYPDVYYSKCIRLGLRCDYLVITASLPTVQWKCLACRFDQRSTRKLLFKTECTVCKWKTQVRRQSRIICASFHFYLISLMIHLSEQESTTF